MNDFLMHYGIPGQKWGVRRYQNEDGTLTDEGKVRYGKSAMPDKYKTKDIQEDANKLYDTIKSNYSKYKDSNGRVSIPNELQESIVNAVKSDSQYVKYYRRMVEKQQKYNDALKTLDLNRRINTYKTLSEAQKDWQLASLGAMFRSVQKLPQSERGRAFGWLYLNAPRLMGAVDDDYQL